MTECMRKIDRGRTKSWESKWESKRKKISRYKEKGATEKDEIGRSRRNSKRDNGKKKRKEETRLKNLITIIHIKK